MSYEIGTDLGRVRELIGDTDEQDEIFIDAYLNDLLSEYTTIGRAAIAAWRRIQSDPGLLRKKFRGHGTLGINDLVATSRMVEEQIKGIKESPLSADATSATDTRFPSADETDIGRATDEDKWSEESTVDEYIRTLKQKI